MWAKVKGVAGKVKDWWKLRKSFQTKKGEKHTAFFRGEGKNAELMIASDPKRAREILNEAKDTEANKPYIKLANVKIDDMEKIQSQTPNFKDRKHWSKDEKKRNLKIINDDKKRMEVIFKDFVDVCKYIEFEKSTENTILLYDGTRVELKWNSELLIGHAWSEHHKNRTIAEMKNDAIRNKDKQEGKWHDYNKAFNQIVKYLPIRKIIIINIPPGLGMVVKADGSVEENPIKAKLVPLPTGGLRTAYPIV